MAELRDLGRSWAEDAEEEEEDLAVRAAALSSSSSLNASSDAVGLLSSAGHDEDEGEEDAREYREQKRSSVEPSTRREQWAWISYDFANSVYNSVAIGLFIPLLLDGVAFMGGFNPATGAPPCVAANETAGIEHACRVLLPGGGSMDNTAFSLNMIAISVGLQAFFFITLAALADYGRLRKLFLVAFGAGGAATTILFITVPEDGYMYAGVLTIVSNILFGLSVVFYNAFLPLLVAADPALLELQESNGESGPVRRLVVVFVFVFCLFSFWSLLFLVASSSSSCITESFLCCVCWFLP